jgi:prevent-host-death family protein
MRSVTIAEAERNLAEVLESATREPVRILHQGHDLIVVSAMEFEEAQEHLHKLRVETLLKAMERCSQEAKDNGFAEDMLPGLLSR